MEFAHIYCMAPLTTELGPVIAENKYLMVGLLPKHPDPTKLLGEWYFKWVVFHDSCNAEAYQDWQNHYKG